MTPAEFASAYRSTAQLVSGGTGIDDVVLLAQWANETAWGAVVVGNNLGNIRCSPTSFCRYASLDDFATACIATFHNGFYTGVLGATTPEAQLAALVASPWSSSHYGGNLHPFYDPLEAYEMTPEEHDWLKAVYTVLSPVSLTQVLGAVNAVKTELDVIKATGITATTDLTPVLSAIAQLQQKLASLTLKAV
jgi:hypothetical protein